MGEGDEGKEGMVIDFPNKMAKKTLRALNSRLSPYLCSKEDETRDRRQSHVSPGRHG